MKGSIHRLRMFLHIYSVAHSNCVVLKLLSVHKEHKKRKDQRLEEVAFFLS